MPDFRHIGYLQQRSAQQQAAYQALTTLGILDTLARYDARLAGTIPLDIATPGSDLDIICHVSEVEMPAFAAQLRQFYGKYPNFERKQKEHYGHTVVICEFRYKIFPMQVYASPVPVDTQRAWVHMLAEAHLLTHGPAGAKEKIRVMKAQGLKTEPAFADYFALGNENDAYEILYQLGLSLQLPR